MAPGAFGSIISPAKAGYLIVVHIVDAANRPLFYPELDRMHCDRARTFGGSDRCKSHGADVIPDIDSFDAADTIYLLESDRRTRRHLASIRLLPTTRPHMLTTVYAHLCEAAVPRDADIWEVSRCCVSPDVPLQDQSRLRTQLRIAIAEFGVFQGIRHYISVTPIHLLPELMASGWDAKPLGLPQMIAGASVGALLFTPTSRALREARDRLACQMSVLEFSAGRAT